MVRVRRRAGGSALALLLSAVLCGCVVATQDTLIVPPIAEFFEGTYAIDPYMERNRPRTVAVLPFWDPSGSKEGFEAVRRGFYNHFSSLPFRDLELVRIDETLTKAGLTDPAQIHKTPPERFGQLLGVDAVVYGEVSDFDKLFLMVYSQVSVGAEIRMFDAKTGHFLWSGRHVARIHEGGLSVTPVGIIATVVATAMNIRDIQLLRACDDLFRDMVKTIPTPPLAEALRPPVISLLAQDTKNLPRKAGDEIRVVIQGTPKMRASFDIGEFKRRIDMEEQSDTPGAYLGVYRVLPGDRVERALITGRLVDDGGNTAEWVDALGTVTLDTTPPDRPGPLQTVGRDRIVLLNWGKSTAVDLAGYRIYRSLSPLSGYREVARTEFVEHRDTALENGVRYYYQVSAVDRAGNESERSDVIAGMPVQPGPTPVRGAIESDTTWYAGASPYVLEGDVTVRDRAVLTIEPGTEVRSRRGALVVEGRLMAQGDGERLILFDTAEGAEIWPGIRFVNVKEKENLLKYVRIRRAQAAVDCEASSPRLESCELAENQTALAVRGTFSAPVVAGNTIRKNNAVAVIISDGAKPTLVDNRIQDNAAEAIAVRSAAPSIRRNAITKNRGGGIVATASQAVVTANSLVDNGPFDLAGEMTGEPVSALDNWWGTARGIEIFTRIRGRVDVRSVLAGPPPEGQPQMLPILGSQLSGPLAADGFLTLAQSPYRVTGDLILGKGAVLTIEPGVVILYDRNTAIVVEDGGVVARGTKELPIVFTAAGASPAPGAFANAVRFTRATKVNSVFAHCAVSFAVTAFDVFYGTPEISFSHIAHNAQSGIYCRNDAAPRISFNTFEGNQGEGGIKCVGMSNPSIQNNNFTGNAVNVQGFSSICIDARYNWWGASPPDMTLIWGDPDKSINIKPWLEAPEGKAFRKP